MARLTETGCSLRRSCGLKGSLKQKGCGWVANRFLERQKDTSLHTGCSGDGFVRLSWMSGWDTLTSCRQRTKTEFQSQPLQYVINRAERNYAPGREQEEKQGDPT